MKKHSVKKQSFIIKSMIFSLLFVLAIFSCKHDKGGGNQNAEPPQPDAKKEPTLKKMTVHGVEVKNDKVTIPLAEARVSSDNIKVFFEEPDAPNTPTCTPATLELNAGESKTLEVSTQASKDYRSFKRTITVTREAKKERNVTKFTIHTLSAISGTVTIEQGSVTKGNIALEFEGEGAVQNFTFSPDPFDLAYSEKKEITITVAESDIDKSK